MEAEAMVEITCQSTSPATATPTEREHTTDEDVLTRKGKALAPDEPPKKKANVHDDIPDIGSTVGADALSLCNTFYPWIQWQQMDIEYTFWQMLHLCTSPKVVYQHTKYHKQTKNQWARDDPAFVVIFCLFLVVATSAYCVAYGESLTRAIFTVTSVVVFHFLLAGSLLATCCWFLTNSYLREEAPNSHVVEQHVEWLYAFDVHCNSFFPAFILLYVIQYFLSPILVAYGFFPILLSNLLFMTAISYYHYLNFLGYDVLPFLDKTTFFLYPIGLVIILSPLMILTGFNPTRYIMNIYFS